MTAYTWGDEPRPATLEEYHAVRVRLDALCADLPEVARRAAWRAGVLALGRGETTAMATSEGLRAARPFRRTPGGSAA